MEKTRIQLIREFFGTKPGQTLTEFMQEYKQLSEADKNELAQAIAKLYNCTVKEGQ